MRAQQVIIEAPATVANVGCGFDIFALAVDGPADRITVALNDQKQVRIVDVTGKGADKLPREPESNIAGFVLFKLREALKTKQGFDVTVEKGIAPGSGMGSSAASAAGAVLGANVLLGEPYSRDDLIPITISGGREVELPEVGLIELVDAEPGKPVLNDPSNSRLRRHFAAAAVARADERTRLFQRCKIDSIDVTTGESFVDPLTRFFKARKTRL